MVEHISKKVQIDLRQLTRHWWNSFKKGHGQYIVVLVNLNTKKPLPLPVSEIVFAAMSLMYLVRQRSFSSASLITVWLSYPSFCCFLLCPFNHFRMQPNGNRFIPFAFIFGGSSRFGSSMPNCFLTSSAVATSCTVMHLADAKGNSVTFFVMPTLVGVAILALMMRMLSPFRYRQ